MLIRGEALTGLGLCFRGFEDIWGQCEKSRKALPRSQIQVLSESLTTIVCLDCVPCRISSNLESTETNPSILCDYILLSSSETGLPASLAYSVYREYSSDIAMVAGVVRYQPCSTMKLWGYIGADEFPPSKTEETGDTSLSNRIPKFMA